MSYRLSSAEKLYWRRAHHVTCNCLQLLKAVIAKYRDLSVSRRIIDLFATDKSRYFAQPRLICQNDQHLSRDYGHFLMASHI